MVAPGILKYGAAGRDRVRKSLWHPTQDALIFSAVNRFGTSWPHIAAICGRSEDAVRNRWHRLQKISRPPLTAVDTQQASIDLEEAPALKARQLPHKEKHARSLWTAEEDHIIEEGYQQHGCKWRLIAAKLPGRSDSSARNRWLRVLKDRQEAHSSADSGTEEVPNHPEDPEDTRIERPIEAELSPENHQVPGAQPWRVAWSEPSLWPPVPQADTSPWPSIPQANGFSARLCAPLAGAAVYRTPVVTLWSKSLPQ